MPKGNESECEGITIGSGEVLGKIDDGGYNYLGIIEWSDICQEKKKMSVKIKCFIPARLALKSQLNAGNVIQAINIWAVSTVKYPAGIIKWTKKELQQIDRKTTKLIIIYRGIRSKSYVDRLYMPRSDGGRGLVSAKDCVEEEKCNLWKYASQSKDTLVKAAGAELSLEKYIANVIKKEKKSRLKECKQKVLHGQFVREIECHNESKKWEWLRKLELKRDTESLLCAEQEQAIRTNSVKYSIDKTSETPRCRLYSENVKTVTHIISACPNLGKNRYQKRRDKVAKKTHWLLYNKFHLECNDKWYKHVPDSVLEIERCKILWDLPIQTDKVVEHRQPNIVCIDNVAKSCLIIDIIKPGDQNIIVKQREKIEK